MDMKKIRKEKLRAWVREHGTPLSEKSFFSQLLSPESSFGERAARRLEAQYGMGDRYLDTTDARTATVGATKAEARAAVAPGQVSAKDIARLITLYGQSTAEGRSFILDSAEVAEKFVPRGRGKTALDQS